MPEPAPGEVVRVGPRVRDLFWVFLVLGVATLARAGYHLVIRDDLWGLAVGLYGLLGLGFLALARRAWRRLRADGRSGELDPRRWFRESTDRTVRRSIVGAGIAVGVGVLMIVVVAPQLDRSRLAAVPWTLGWCLVAGLAWRERRRRGGQLGRGWAGPPG